VKELGRNDNWFQYNMGSGGVIGSRPQPGQADELKNSSEEQAPAKPLEKTDGSQGTT